MSYVFNRGGGGAALNFKVVGGTTQPTSASVNTIWVNTSTAISDWVFSAVEPLTANEGTVWIKTGTSSPVEFNALKKNSIIVYPTSAAQYVSDEWVAKTAKSYDGTTWNDCTDLTGGWGSGGSMDTSAGYSNNSSMTKNTDSILLTVAPVSGYMLSTVNKIDLTSYKKLYMDVTAETGISEDARGPGAWLVVRTAKTGSWSPGGQLTTLPPGTVASQVFNSPGVVELDISTINGEYYIGAAIAGYSAKTANISSIYLGK